MANKPAPQADQASAKEKRNPRAKAMRWSIGRKLILIVAVGVTVGLAALVTLQFWSQRTDLMRDAQTYKGIISSQLADAVSGGVKWEKIDVVDKAYEEILGNTAAGLASIVVFNSTGTRLTGADDADLAPYDLTDVLAVAGGALDQGSNYAAFDGDHLVMAYPILAGADRIGTLALAWSAAELNARVEQVLLSGVAVGGAVLVVLVGLLVVVLGRSVSRPLGHMTRAMQRLADGDHEIEVPALARGDEIGDMARAVQVFKDNAIEVDRLKADRETEQRRATEERHNAMLELAARFEADLGSLVDAVSAASGELQSTARAMTTTAEESKRQTSVVAEASEEASTNVQTVAAATEELSASVSEISRQVTSSAEIAGRAVSDATRTNVQVQGLADAAQKIGEVVQLITDIASQTNLLALNATIEAARAGEAGKGFAVVASEVKNLANETAKATEEISAQIAAIQSATLDSVTAIGGIGGTIKQIDEIATAIAEAVAQQGSATREIARNVQEAAAGTAEVSRNIDGVTEAAGQTGAAAGRVLSSAEGLAELGTKLRNEMARFLEQVRAA